MNEHNENDKLRVLLLKPGELAEIAEIEDDLESMQRLVEGNFATHLSKVKNSCPCRLIWKRKCGRNSSFRSSFMSRKTESGRKNFIQ